MNQPSNPAHYLGLLSDIKQRIGQAQTRAVLAVNAELIRLYWEIGQMLELRQNAEGWGAAVIPRLALDIHNELPEEKGFSERNIKRMLAFYREYRSLEFVPQAVAQIDTAEKSPPPSALFTPELVMAIPWGHHLLLIEKIKNAEARFWYMQATLSNGWSRNILQLQIESDAHARQGKPIGVSTFELTRALPSALASKLPSIEQIERELGNVEGATE